MEPRRSRRKRVSRYIKVDGYSILKLNNYSLEEGEKSVYAHEARGSAPINLPKTKTAFQLFAASFKDRYNGLAGRDFASLQKATAAAWRALVQSEREPFHALAATQAEEREKKLQSLRHQQQQEMLGQQLQRKHVLKNKKLQRPRTITGAYQKLVFDIISRCLRRVRLNS